MSIDEIVPLTKQKIPTIVGYDVLSSRYTIGEEARQTGILGKGQTAVFNFKPTFGLGDKDFAQDRNKGYWLRYPTADPKKPYHENFSAKGAALRFLRTLFADVELPEKVIVGEPAVREDAWRGNFRRHMREVFSELGIAHLDFFPEPFAVFQYYRHVDKAFAVAKQAEIVLIIDIGGGTFNSCIIRTTEQGLLARGGATSLPLGLQAVPCGGAHIDKELLKKVIDKARQGGLVWKDDPMVRIEKRESPGLLRIEDAKIRLSDTISHRNMSRLSDDYSDITTQVLLPKGECHPDFDIKATLTGEDLKDVIREMWRRHYSAIIADTVNEAKKQLEAVKSSLDRIDKVLVAGGSSQLPFTKEEIATVLPTLVNKNNIFIGSDIGEAVAYGIAFECREQVKRDPGLSVGNIAQCIMSDLYLGFRGTRREIPQLPHIKCQNVSLKNGQLLLAPFEHEGTILEYDIELPFEVPDRLFYVFTDKPIRNDEEDVTLLNLGHDVFAIPKLNKLSKRCRLQLEIKPNGFIKPIFWFRGKGDRISKDGQKMECPEFYCAGFQGKEGSSYIGFDFGTSNSYLVNFVSIPQEITASQYPEFIISSKTKKRLRELELRIKDLREKGYFTPEQLIEHAKNQAIEIIFHSNKIEGNPLSRGETEYILSQPSAKGLSEKELEAKNLEAAYYWMLEHVESCFDQPEAFIREINRMIVKDIKPNDGQYRTESVSLSGMDFVPPQGSAVPAYMQQLGEEVKNGIIDRSSLEFAASLHTKLVAIHPFIDGNGRTARLLLNACLLAQVLPVVIVNYADRERYLHCLSDSNKGDLSSIVEFFIECLEQQLDDFTVAEVLETSVDISKELPLVTPTHLQQSEVDVIDQAIRETNLVLLDDPLSIVMQEKILEHENLRRTEYEAWNQSFLTILAELKTIVESFNSNEKYTQIGYLIRLQEYDLLPFEKYEELSSGKNATETWFVGIEISGPHSSQKALLCFSQASWRLMEIPKANKVSLVVSRFDGARYQRLDTEPISLREIGYQDGELLFLSPEGAMPVRGARRALERLLADIIGSYL